jgi:hypothetical protein
MLFFDAMPFVLGLLGNRNKKAVRIEEKTKESMQEH